MVVRVKIHKTIFRKNPEFFVYVPVIKYSQIYVNNRYIFLGQWVAMAPWATPLATPLRREMMASHLVSEKADVWLIWWGKLEAAGTALHLLPPIPRKQISHFR